MFERFHGLVAALVLVLGVISSAETCSAERPPNVLMFAVDDLNDWVEPLGGHPNAQTPNMAALAARGMTFTNAHCQSPLCNSSRSSLLFSMRPSTTGVYGLGPLPRDAATLKDRVSLPQYFQSKGYATYTAGKIFHYSGGRLKGDFQTIGPRGGPGITPPKKLVPPTPAGNNPWVDWGVFEHRDEDKQDYKVASWVIDRLGELPEDQPFFMACGFFLPHVPCHAPPKWWDRFEHESLLLPNVPAGDRDDCSPFSWYLHWNLPEPRIGWLRKHDQLRNLVHAYLACTTFSDHQLGRVLDALAESPHADNTVICLWGDHGWHLGEKDISGKNSLWEPSTRVPLIFAGPGVPQNVRTDSPAELLDVYPTLADLALGQSPADIQGESLRRQMRDPSVIRVRPAITDHNPGNHGLRDQRFRLIRYADGTEELYDVPNDPDERTNLINDPKFAADAERLRTFIPETSAPLAPGSHSRILENRDDGWYWEGKKIDPDNPPMK